MLTEIFSVNVLYRWRRMNVILRREEGSEHRVGAGEGGPSFCPHTLGLTMPPEMPWEQSQYEAAPPPHLPPVRKASLRGERSAACFYTEEFFSFLSDGNLT